MPKTSRSIVINASPQACYDVIWDCESHPEFLSELQRAKILDHRDDFVRAEFTVRIVKEIKYTIDLHGTPGASMSWKLVKGFFKKNDGLWTLRDLGDGRTECTYDIDIEFGLMVPGSVVKMLQEQQLPKLLEAFKKRIESLN
ncbi:MAG: SRPBCC family protein [Candidatus Lernaella stagnicola]|nr:SRPBCC family protein [Candidatus Lernaella stagnicola]